MNFSFVLLCVLRAAGQTSQTGNTRTPMSPGDTRLAVISTRRLRLLRHGVNGPCLLDDSHTLPRAQPACDAGRRCVSTAASLFVTWRIRDGR
jgi:hypothetical protein